MEKIYGGRGLIRCIIRHSNRTFQLKEGYAPGYTAIQSVAIKFGT